MRTANTKSSAMARLEIARLLSFQRPLFTSPRKYIWLQSRRNSFLHCYRLALGPSDSSFSEGVAKGAVSSFRSAHNNLECRAHDLVSYILLGVAPKTDLCSPTASVSSASPFAPPPTSNDLSASADMLSALSLEGKDVKKAISRGGSK